MSQPSFRDVEMLSAYLDGQLSQVDSTRLESRIKTDPGLRSVYDDLRQSLSLLRKLPVRRAPHNFTLTPKMAGIKPPLPRAFPIFRLASVLAAILFFFSYAVNLSVPTIAAMRAAPAPAYGRGGGGGFGGEPSAAMAPAATEAVAPAEAATEAPAIAETATPELAQQDNLALPPTSESRLPGTQGKFDPYAQNGSQRESQPLTLPVPPVWLFGLLALAVISGGTALLVRARAEQEWRKANAVKPRKMATRDILLFGLVLLAILLLGAGIYWMSTTTFYAPVAQSITYPAGPAGGDKGSLIAGSGDKGSAPAATAQEIHLSPGLGYSFSASDNNGVITGIDFPVDAVKEETDLRYIPGLDTIAPHGIFFADRAFTLIPLSKGTMLQAPITITMDYDNEVSAAANGRELSLYWWSGGEWLDVASTCSPESTYERLPDSNRIRVAACQFGSFLLVAP